MSSFANLLLPILLIATLSPKPTVSYTNHDMLIQQDPTESSLDHAYIVLVEPPLSSTGEDAHRRWHESFLPSSLLESGEPRLLHSYTEVFSGFAARLSNAELQEVAKKPGFVRSFPDRKLQLMTTHTPEFLGLRNGTGFWSAAGYGKGVIVGLLDTGIHAAHPSFDDHGIAPPPKKWKGSCKGSAARCNNKLIGAKSFVGGDSGDEEGHGTHTSSTAAGNFVAGASIHGLGAGTAAGIAPGAHIAMYKVCGPGSCTESSILAGLDAAIKDGVDVLSISLGGSTSVSFDADPIAIGSFSAVSKGITVVCAAGNAGPAGATVTNDAPWLLTVAASTMDRSFQAGVHLGNGKSIDAEALTQVTKSSAKSYPIQYSDDEQGYCEYESVGGHVSGVDGKIVVCRASDYQVQRLAIGAILQSGAAGVVVISDPTYGYTNILREYASGAVQVTANDGDVITGYATSTKNSTATFTYNNTVLGIRPSPVVAFFSSRGPSFNSPGILKPDILAPGLNILAAWPPNARSVDEQFYIISGTSMATPHISGVVALLKSSHPDWSPAAIRSAILTTSDAVNKTGGSILDEQHAKATVYATGAGHVNPTRAADPGLVYDLSTRDYAGYICWLLGDGGLATIVGNSSLTCKNLPKIFDVHLNYPTITVPATLKPYTVNRTVTNVGPAESTYKLKLDVPKSLTVRVTPDTLVFTKAGEKKTYNISVSGQLGGQEHFLEGSLSWVSGKHVVRSPIVALSGFGSPPPSSVRL